MIDVSADLDGQKPMNRMDEECFTIHFPWRYIMWTILFRQWQSLDNGNYINWIILAIHSCSRNHQNCANFTHTHFTTRFHSLFRATLYLYGISISRDASKREPFSLIETLFLPCVLLVNKHCKTANTLH